MKPPVEFQDRSLYTARMNELLRIDPGRTVVLTVELTVAELKAKLGGA